MILSRESIISKTHYGFKIYAYVLRQYYPKEELLIAQHFSKPVRNPFNNGRKTLVLKVENGCAVHEDLEIASFKGDAFQFANEFFQMATQQELYFLLNRVLNLGLEVETEYELAWLDEEDDSWSPRFSFYNAPIRNVFPAQQLSLSEVYEKIIGNEYQGITEKLRKIENPKQRSVYKSNFFPYVTFSGTFKKRSETDLIKHSLLITFDFDHLKDLDRVKRELLEDEFFETELMFTSPSGNGLKWIVKWDQSQGTHRSYFEGVSNYLRRTYHLEADPSGKDTPRACFLCQDSFAVIHPRHLPLPSAESTSGEENKNHSPKNQENEKAV